MNSVGEHTSMSPVQKIYEATHGICKVCGTHWLEAVIGSGGGSAVITQSEDGWPHVHCAGETLLPKRTPVPENEGKAPASVLASSMYV